MGAEYICLSFLVRKVFETRTFLDCCYTFSIYAYHCHHQNDFCINMGSDESHCNVSFIVRVKITRQYPQTTTFEEKGEPKRIRTEVLLLTNLTPYR